MSESLKPPRAEALRNGPRLVRSKFQGKAFLIPSCITMAGIFCGFLAIVSAVNGKFEYATRCIFIAFVLDGLDGQVARRLNATSEFGKEFDSLSDLVTFGVAPAMLTYTWAFVHSFDEFGVLISFFFLACGATRLARFNVRTTDEPSKYFEGLPIPGAAVAITSIVFMFPEPVTNFSITVALLCYVAILGILMVSTLPYLSIKKLNFRSEHSRRFISGLALAVAVTWYSPRIALLTTISLYVLSAPAISSIRLFKKSRSAESTKVA